MRRYFYINDRKFVVRFFDENSAQDLSDLSDIIRSPGAQRWMDEVDDDSVNGLRSWMMEKGQGNRFLFAIADIETREGEGRVHGFVYIYPRQADKALEISYARRPDGVSGLTADGIHLALEIVQAYIALNRPWMSERLKFMAEIERGNLSSIRVIEKAGFIKVTDFDRSNNALWVLTIKDRKLEYRPRKVGRVRQVTGAYCGPAVVQILAAHFGVALDQEAIVDAAGVRDKIELRGISVEQMAKAVGVLMPDYTLWIKMESSLDDIEKMVRVYNYPVAVNWQGIFEKNEYANRLTPAQMEAYEDEEECKGEEGHYSVVVDIDKTMNYVRIMDPYGHYSEEDRFIALGEFEQRWWDDRMDYPEDGTKQYFYAKQLMFALVPRGISLPENIGMKEII